MDKGLKRSGIGASNSKRRRAGALSSDSSASDQPPIKKRKVISKTKAGKRPDGPPSQPPGKKGKGKSKTKAVKKQNSPTKQPAGKKGKAKPKSKAVKKKNSPAKQLQRKKGKAKPKSKAINRHNSPPKQPTTKKGNVKSKDSTIIIKASTVQFNSGKNGVNSMSFPSSTKTEKIQSRKPIHSYPPAPSASVAALNNQRRIVFFGKTGVGKSSTCNTIIGENVVNASRSLCSDTVDCNRYTTIQGEKKIILVDTPGMYDTRRSEAETVSAVVKCIHYSSPGPHVFVCVLSCNNRYTAEEENTLRYFKAMFGPEIYNYTIFLFTNSDALKGTSITNYKKTFPTDLKYKLKLCNNRMVFFDNHATPAKKNKSVATLLKMVEDVVKKNKSFYSNDLFKSHFTSAEVIAREMQNAQIKVWNSQLEKVENELQEMRQERDKTQEKVLAVIAEFDEKQKSLTAKMQRKSIQDKNKLEKLKSDLEKERENNEQQRESLETELGIKEEAISKLTRKIDKITSELRAKEKKDSERRSSCFLM